jgi:hypothetical protein
MLPEARVSTVKRRGVGERCQHSASATYGAVEEISLRREAHATELIDQFSAVAPRHLATFITHSIFATLMTGEGPGIASLHLAKTGPPERG